MIVSFAVFMKSSDPAAVSFGNVMFTAFWAYKLINDVARCNVGASSLLDDAFCECVHLHFTGLEL